MSASRSSIQQPLHAGDSESPTALNPINSRPETLTELVYASIRDAIMTNRIAPGQRLTESALAQQLSVSKTPVREALLRLAYVGLIEAEGARGGRVATPSREKIRNAYEVRAGIEAHAAQGAAERISPENLAALMEIAQECLDGAESHDLQAFRSADQRFHLKLAESTENPYLYRLIRDAYDLTWALRRRDVPAADDSVRCARQHIEIMRAISDDDGTLAASIMRQHINEVRDIVLAAFGTDSGVPAR
jgi:DNA-binding GntR family transcriptional regulator